jgi:hypothetical protein
MTHSYSVWANYINREEADAGEDADKTVISSYHNTTDFPAELDSLFVIKSHTQNKE